MYAWIWRKLPFGLWGKLLGSLLLVSGVVSLLWYVIFPWAEPLLPFDDVQVGDPGSDPGGGDPGGSDPDGGNIVGVDPSLPPGENPDDHDIPYDTGEG